MMGRDAVDARLLHIIHRPYPVPEFRRQPAQQHRRERKAHAQIPDEIHDGFVQRAWLRRRRIDLASEINQNDLFAGEYRKRLCTIAAFTFHAQAIGPAQRDCAVFAEFDLLSGRLHGVVSAA
jgi:hypothetical protein